jgi:hypothetical protein
MTDPNNHPEVAVLRAERDAAMDLLKRVAFLLDADSWPPSAGVSRFITDWLTLEIRINTREGGAE